MTINNWFVSQWIPVSEQEYPKTEGSYLTTIICILDNCDDIYVEQVWYNGCEWDITHSMYKVLAWMPMPEPYKEVTENAFN
jgi:hypothetical protein